MSESTYTEIACGNAQYLYDKNLILIVTATELETRFIHKKIKPLAGYDNILKVFDGDITLYLGILGNYKIAHVQTSMGSISRDSSIMTVSSALSKTKSKIVIMVGIAFGVDPGSQRFGDVLISESIIPYNPRKVSKKIIKRGIEAPSSKVLLNRFKNINSTWEHIINGDHKAKLFPTRLLSGEELIDNLDYRNSLLEENPESKGGEMEGAGVYAACDGRADWIIVKGICDFADGNKSEKKNERQTIAIESALSACMEVFNSFSAFAELDVVPIISDKSELIVDFSKSNQVLFDIYDVDKEQYYISRRADDKILSSLRQFSIWIFGPTGCGKSNIILRNLLLNKVEFIPISLASCVGSSVNSIFNEILYELSSVCGVKSQTEPSNFQECSKAIINVLLNKFPNKELVIFIEEIPLASEAQFDEFSNKIFSLLISKNLIGTLNDVKFALSSINNPKDLIKTFQHKIHQQLSFIPLEYWERDEIHQLILIIEQCTNINLPSIFVNELMENSIGSPRFIKKFFRSLLTNNKFDEENLIYILKETIRDLRLNNV
jgi:nucleoside phosphorylase